MGIRMRFINMTNNKDISRAMEDAESLLAPGSKMMDDLYLKNDFEYGSGNVINTLMIHRVVKIFTYRPWSPFTRAIAMTNGDGAIHFNIYKISKTTPESKVATILHEYAHIAGFSHGNNYKTKHKCEFSVPYYLSENIARWL